MFGTEHSFILERSHDLDRCLSDAVRPAGLVLLGHRSGRHPMSRNFGVTRPSVSGAQPLTASHYAPGTRRNSNSFAGATPPCQPDLVIVVSGHSFIRTPERPLKEVQPAQPHFDHREFAAYVFLSVVGISIGVLLAAATAFLDWSF